MNHHKTNSPQTDYTRSLKTKDQCKKTGCGTGQCTRGSCSSGPQKPSGPGNGFDSANPSCGCSISDLGGGNTLIRLGDDILLNGVSIASLGDVEELSTTIANILGNLNGGNGYWETLIAIDRMCYSDRGADFKCTPWQVSNRDLIGLAYCAAEDNGCDDEASLPNDDGELVRVKYEDILIDLKNVETSVMGVSGGDGSHGLLRESYTAMGVAMPAFYCVFNWLVCGVGVVGGVTFGQLGSCEDPLTKGCTGGLTRAFVLTGLGATVGKLATRINNKYGKLPKAC